jgi:inner membrane protein
MDLITHSLAGIAVGTFSGEPLSFTNPIYISSILGAMSPDIDVIWSYKRLKRKTDLPKWLQHRAITHSIVGMPLLAAGIALSLNIFFTESSFLLLFIFALIGAISHSLLDLTNCYGVNILWPFMKKNYSLNIVPLVDPILISILIIMGLVVNWYKAFTPALLFILICYVILRRIYFFHTRNVVSMYYAVTPSSIHMIPPRYGFRKWKFSINETIDITGEVIFFPKINLMEKDKDTI